MEDNQQDQGLLEMTMRPIGVVRSEVKKPALVAESDDLQWQSQGKWQEHKKRISELVIDKSRAGCLDGVEGFSHLLVLYWAHLVRPGGRQFTKVHPMGRDDLPLTGIFATCSPARPNPICVTAVRLLERVGNILRVEGLDAVDGSPVVDIKPYNPGFCAVDGVKVADWMEKIYQEKGQ